MLPTVLMQMSFTAPLQVNSGKYAMLVHFYRHMQIHMFLYNMILHLYKAFIETLIFIALRIVIHFCLCARLISVTKAQLFAFVAAIFSISYCSWLLTELCTFIHTHVHTYKVIVDVITLANDLDLLYGRLLGEKQPLNMMSFELYCDLQFHV